MKPDTVMKIGEELAAHLTKLFETEDFRSLVEQTKASPEGDTGTFEVIITTENLDRYQEVISIDGWELAHYLANPVVLWGHDHNRIIGVCTSLEKRDGKLIAKGKFAPTAEGQEKRVLYEQGFLRTTSVGFIEKEREGNLITKAELLEFSFVAVPANPYALSLAMKSGRSIDELVTKGIVFVEKEADTTPEATEAPTANEDAEDGADADPEPDAPAEGENEGQDVPADARDFSTKRNQAIASMKEAIIALEALDTTVEEPERDENEPTADEDISAARAHLERKRAIQKADTVLGEILAELRAKSRARD